jgi:tRNA-specific 2-thiouridylase
MRSAPEPCAREGSACAERVGAREAGCPSSGAGQVGSVAERIVVGMSGGVDSSVAAALLVEAGHDVVGITLRVWPWREADEPAGRFGSCCSPATVEDARNVARALGIPYYLLNSEQEFDRTVIRDFAETYRAGRTPVPCVACNRDLKFGSLLRRARAWDAAAVATGHYARVTRDAASRQFWLWRGVDPAKDQSDFLWPLSQAQLAGARFPVGGLTKAEVRARARALGLVTADKPESQEICFVPEGDYRSFLRRRDPAMFVPGPILDDAGARVGTHGGLANYTVGQRRGLPLTSARPRYVADLDPARNAVIVADAAALESDRLTASQANFIGWDPPTSPTRVQAKIRHSHAPAPATVRVVDDRDRIEVVFDEPQRAITPGQSVVLYDGARVLGGAVIERRAP